VISLAVRRELGAVPTSFFDSADRGHPLPWRDLREVLRRYGESEPDHDDVIDGARATFVAFQKHLAAGWDVAGDDISRPSHGDDEAERRRSGPAVGSPSRGTIEGA
jgi:hypothetical protein